jgi:hypothetical protein
MKHAKTVKINPHTVGERAENTISDYKAFSAALELRGLKGSC